MKTYRHELIFNFPVRRGFVNITSGVLRNVCGKVASQKASFS